MSAPVNVNLTLEQPAPGAPCSVELPRAFGLGGPCRSAPVAGIRIRFAFMGIDGSAEGVPVNLCQFHLSLAQLAYQRWLETKGKKG